MKCPYCGGEVPSQSTKCPYCGMENPEGVAFQEEVQRKIERNRLLRPFLLKQKKPELVQKMLTRILLLVTVFNVLLIMGSFGLYYWSYSANSEDKEPAPGSRATHFRENYYDANNFWQLEFYTDVDTLVTLRESRQEISYACISSVVYSAYSVMREADSAGTEEKAKTEEFCRVFFGEYLGLNEQEMEFLQPGDDGKYAYSQEENLMERAIQAISEKTVEEQP